MGRVCKMQTVNLGNTLETPEICADKARTSDKCHGYFMHSPTYWASWGCRCCTNSDYGESNDNWNMYQYDLHTSGLDDAYDATITEASITRIISNSEVSVVDVPE